MGEALRWLHAEAGNGGDAGRRASRVVSARACLFGSQRLPALVICLAQCDNRAAAAAVAPAVHALLATVAAVGRCSLDLREGEGEREGEEAVEAAPGWRLLVLGTHAEEECDEDGEATVVAPGLVRVFSLPLLLRVHSILQRNADSSQDSANVIVR